MSPGVAPLVTKDVVKVFGKGRRRPAVDGVSIELAPGETFALVGESGCGKTTLARMVVGLLRPTSGHILVGGRDVWSGGLRGQGAFRRAVQMVFQDPGGALDPRQTVGSAIEEPLHLHGLGTPVERRRRVARLLEMVGLGAEEAGRFPHQLSGGQKQRVFIARVLGLEPRLLILDEPVSALDVSVRAQVLNLLRSLQGRLGLTFFLISHDLTVVRRLADDVAVMHRGRLVEQGPAEAVWANPGHPYTRALLEASPVPDPSLRPAAPAEPPPEFGEPPWLADRASCLYEPICDHPGRPCRRLRPELAGASPTGPGGSEVRRSHLVACHFPLS